MSFRKKKNTRQQETKPRAKRGHFDYEVVTNRLRLVVPGNLSPTDKRIRPALNLEATLENEAKAKTLVEQLNAREFIFNNYERDQLSNYIDEFFGRTKIETSVLSAQKPSFLKQPDLDIIWSEYTVSQEKSELYKETTLLNIYPTIAAHIKRLTTRELSEHEQIFKEIKKLSKTARYRTMVYISAACNWAVKKGKIKENPFSDYPKRLRVPKSDAEPDPFGRQESAHVMEAYRKHRRYYCFADLVTFKFLTGCRTGEAITLKWKNVNLEEGWIYFCESISVVQSKHIYTKGTKTGRSRYFKITSQLKVLLEKLRPAHPDPEGFVFKGTQEGHVDGINFYYSWHGKSGKNNGIIHKLIDQGLVHHYRPPYNTRHTFISLAVDEIFKDKDSGKQFGRKLSTLARRVGNTAVMILEHYLGLSDDDEMLNIDFDEEPVTDIQAKSPGHEDLLQQLALANRHLEEANQRNAELIALIRDHMLRNSSSTSHQPCDDSIILPISTAAAEDFHTDLGLSQQLASVESSKLSDAEMEQLLLFSSLKNLINE